MANKLKTKATVVSVDDFIDGVDNPVRRADALVARALFERVTQLPATMWGPTIIGFGSYRYKYESGHEGEMCKVGFSPRSTSLVFYVGFPDDAELFSRLGKHKRSKACVYVNKLTDIDTTVLEEIVRKSLAHVDATNSCAVC